VAKSGDVSAGLGRERIPHLRHSASTVSLTPCIEHRGDFRVPGSEHPQIGCPWISWVNLALALPLGRRAKHMRHAREARSWQSGDHWTFPGPRPRSLVPCGRAHPDSRVRPDPLVEICSRTLARLSDTTTVFGKVASYVDVKST
jgi:hypothetical protein